MALRKKIDEEMSGTIVPPHSHNGYCKKRWIPKLVCWVLFILLFSFLIVSIFGEKLPKVSDNSVLVMTNYGNIKEYNRNEIPMPMMSEHGETLLDMIYSLKKAAVDERIRGVVFRIGYFNVGMAQATELRNAIVDYKKSGKKIYAYSENFSTTDYYIASACDKVYLIPQGSLDFRGLSFTKRYLRGALEKIGLKVEFVRIKNYKTAMEAATEYEMTPFDKEQFGAILDTSMNEITQAVSKSRKMDSSEVLKIIDESPLTLNKAVEKKMVDGGMYLDQIIDSFKQKDEVEQKTISDEDYRKIPAEKVGLNKGPVIALVYATGTIIDGKDSNDLLGGESMGSHTLTEQLAAARLDKDVKAVVFRIDSGGGSGSASEAIMREIIKLKEAKKPIIVSMGNVAASGGYYIACQADKIVAQPTTITGSIGVFNLKLNLYEFYKKIGINKTTLKRGKFSDLYSDFRPATEEEKKLGLNLINDFYQTFLIKVADGRKMKVEDVDKIGQGRVWSGADAKKVGLVDELGGMDKAIEIAKQMANIKPEEDVKILLYPKRKSVFEILFDGEGKETIKVDQTLGISKVLPKEYIEALSLIQIMGNSNGYKVYAMMPFICSFE